MSFWETVLEAKTGNPSCDGPLPALVDEIAKRDPHRVCFSFPRSQNFAGGFQDLSFRTFANAINKTAHFLHREIGRSSMFETVTYMGFPDVRHYIVLIALMKTGHKLLFTSHHDPLVMTTELLRQTDSSILLFTSGAPVDYILEHCRLETIRMPELAYLLDDTITCAVYPYTSDFDQATFHPCVVTHITSSTKRRPKPITWTHGALWNTEACSATQPRAFRHDSLATPSSQPLRVFSTCSTFDGVEIFRNIKQAICQNSTIVIPHQDAISVDAIREVVRYGNINVLECASALLDDIVRRSDVLESFAKLQHITCVNGKISSEVLHILSHYVQVHIPRARTEPSTPFQQHTAIPSSKR